jgi:hypothetical protein
MRSPSRCGSCRAEIQNPLARFCSKCGGVRAARSHWAVTSIRLLAFPLVLVGRALAYPIRRRRERIRWLKDASGPHSPINQVPGLRALAREA